MESTPRQVLPAVAGPARPGTHRVRPSARRRRPSGEAPPLPHHLQTSGVGWLVALVVLVALSIAVFNGGLRGPAVAVTVLDDAVVRWLAGLDALGLAGTWQALAFLGSWWVLNLLALGLVLALLALRRFRHLIVTLIVAQLLTTISQDVVGSSAHRPRPFGVEIRTGWGSWALPSLQVMNLAATLVIILYTLVPEGRWRQRGKWVATGVVALAGLGRIALGAEGPTDVLVGAAIGVAIPLALFRLFTPNEVFPISYRRGRAAHLDVTGARGTAIRRGLEDQLGLTVAEVKPFGLAGSAGSTPLRITVKGDPPTQLFGKLYARSHLRADRWYKLGRELLYGRLEDEKPFNTVRRLVQQEDYALRLCRDAGLPSPRPYGVVELTPEREYLLVTEFFDDATELGEAEVDTQVIDDGLEIIRKLWEAGLAHRDIKPANLLVRDHHLLLIDVAFIELRPTPGARPSTWPT
jgi:membrane-associated phospholipid phosphatase